MNFGESCEAALLREIRHFERRKAESQKYTPAGRTCSKECATFSENKMPFGSIWHSEGGDQFGHLQSRATGRALVWEL